MIVSKFGGSSMKDAQAMLRSAAVAKRQQSNIVLVSATYKTTDKILGLIKTAETQSWQACEKDLFEIEQRHLGILKELGGHEGIKTTLLNLLEEFRTMVKGVSLLKECSPRAKDSIVSFGERLSSALFSLAVNKTFEGQNTQLIDIRDVLKTNSTYGKALPDLGKIKERAQTTFNDKNTVYVTQGFIGSDAKGATTTLGRGGSDYSASLIAEAVDATTLEIWTDVAGIATTDPRICQKAQAINQISFQEASELATYGAKVLHPTTLAPAMRSNIPVFVGSSFEEDAQGTWIKNETPKAPLVRAITKRDNQSLLTIRTPKMLHAFGFMSKIFDVFSRHEISVDSVSTSEISVAITIDESTLENDEFISELKTLGQVDVETDLCLVSIIGNKMHQTSGLGERMFKALGDINVRMICLGASEHNLCFVTGKDRADEAISKLHHFFIEEQL